MANDFADAQQCKETVQLRVLKLVIVFVHRGARLFNQNCILFAEAQFSEKGNKTESPEESLSFEQITKLKVAILSPTAYVL